MGALRTLRLKFMTAITSTLSVDVFLHVRMMVGPRKED
jgi:hypothetical protein